MDTIDQFDLKSLLESKGFKVQHDPNGYKIQALWRGGDGYNVSISKRTGQFFDFVEAKGGSLSQLLQIVGGELDYNLIPSNYEEEIIWPKRYDQDVLKSLKFDYKYWNGRGISYEICKLFGGGIADHEVMPKLRNRYVTPIFSEKKELQGFTSRYVGNHPDAKKQKNIGNKKEWVFPLYLNKKEIIKTNRVYLMEGMGDIYSMFECGLSNSLCFFGTSLSSKLLNKLISLNLNKIIICENNDPVNSHGNRPGQDAAQKIKKQLLNFFDESVVKIINPAPFKDINEMLCKEGKESIYKTYGQPS